MTTDPTATRHEEFAFTGNGHEYFRIWIVNLALSVVTLGIYSAWAKVRRLQYFYRNVRVAGAGFDYHGQPIAILKGRIVAAILIGSYYLAAYFSPVAAAVVALLLAAVMPWLLVRSLKFMLYNSSYRAIRFHFHGSTEQSYWVMLGLPILSVATLFLLTPFWHHRLKHFQHANAAYGSTRFGFQAPVSKFYKAYLVTVLCFIGMWVFALLWVFFFAAITAARGPSADPSTLPTLLIVALMVVYVFVATAVWSLTMAQIQNLVWRHTTLGRHRFTSTVEAHKLLGLVMTNTLAMIVTLGLFKPYADVRLTRYLVGEMTLVTTGTLDEFVASAEREVAALGDEAIEMFDIDLAF
jgi:uncharacterized membrane protein YjgN (DUF898 family)